MCLCINPSCPQPRNGDDHLFCQGCGSELLLEGRYRLMARRGQGGFGTTYEVSDRDGHPKILKVLLDNQPKHVELFQREAQLLSQLNHPGIPKVEPDSYFTHAAKGQLEPLHCLVMEKIVGLDLQEYLKQRGTPIDHKLALRWLGQVAEILEVIHAQHVLHRDIKPSNIMPKADGNLALVDFGTARSVTNLSSGQQGTRVVSSFYTPREQMHGQAVAQSDFFALGRTFVYLLTNKDLSEFYNAATDTLDWHDAAPNIPTPLVEFIDDLMASVAGQRPAQANVIVQRLAEIKAACQPPTRASTAVQRGYAPTQVAMPVGTPTPSPAPRGQSQPQPVVPSPASAPPHPPQRPYAPQRSGPLDPNFVQRCQQELAECIGPMASILCQRAMAQAPQSSPQEFIELLAQQVPDPQAVQDFRQRLTL